MGWIYYYISFLSGTIELGTLVWGLSHGYGLMEVLGLVMAYQLGNVVLYTVPARVEKRAWAFLAGAVFLFLAGAFLPAAHDVRYALVWVSFAVASTFLQLEREAVKVKVAQWKKWKKRAFRVLGFLASALISTAAGTALVAVYMVSLLVLGFVLPEFGYDGWLRRLAAGQLGQPRVCWAMVTHQAHYFAYTYVLFAIACAYYGGTLVPVLWFVANWVPYTITEPLVRTLKLERYYRGIAIGAHVFNALVLTGVYLCLLRGSMTGALCLWILTGFGGGNVFCIREALKPAAEYATDVWMFSEQLGHILGLAACLVTVWLSGTSAVMLLGALFAAVTIPVILAILHRGDRHE